MRCLCAVLLALSAHAALLVGALRETTSGRKRQTSGHLRAPELTGPLSSLPWPMSWTADMQCATEPHVKASSSEMFPDCALVSSAEVLRGRGLGAKIDSHYPVIRVNRMPTEEFYEDFGNRTDILWGNCYMAHLGRIALMSSPGSSPGNCTNLAHPLCSKKRRCYDGSPGCPTTAVVTRCEPSKEWSSYRLPIGHIHDDMKRLAETLRFHGKMVSTGQLAFLTMLPACEHMTLYGFSGVGNADGHGTDAFHDLQQEHELYKATGKGLLTLEDWGGFPEGRDRPKKTRKDWGGAGAPSGEDLVMRLRLLQSLNTKQIAMVP